MTEYKHSNTQMQYYDYLIVGAGLSGAVLAERLATINNDKILIIDKRNHIAGNCYDYIDENDILINKYGAHLFHTNSERVWKYVNTFTKWERWDHKVLSYIEDKYVPIPVNINTVNILCNENITTETEMDKWLLENQITFNNAITNSEEMAKSRVGEILFNKLFRPYTIKQWNKEPFELDKLVLARIPVRNNWDDRYFNDKYQALPQKGYTNFVTSILNHPNITVLLNTDFFDLKKSTKYRWKTVIYTGQIDNYFNKDNNGTVIDSSKTLEYRSINFEVINIKNMNYWQPVSVVNYPELNVQFTRIVEYKHFLNQKSPHTTIVKEITCDYGEPYYPVPTDKNISIYEEYRKKAEQETYDKNVHFIGRLANYKYFNMDQAIENALLYYDQHFTVQLTFEK